MTSLEIFVMSKCPDAFYCEHFIASLGIDVQVRFEFINNADGSCKHGSEECDGNRALLAIQEHMDLLPFFETYNKRPELIGQWNYAVECLDVEKEVLKRIHTTYKDESFTLLKKSGDYAKAVGAQYSATVMAHGKIIAVRDDNQWKSLAPGLSDQKADWIRYLESKEDL